MKNMAWCIIFMLLLFSGCATEKAWYNPNKTSQEFYQDLSMCEAMSNSAGSSQIMPGGYAGGFVGGFTNTWNRMSAIEADRSRERIFGNCMMGNGWSIVDKNSTFYPKERKKTKDLSEDPSMDYYGMGR